jgi:hypothetical protein
VKLLTTETTLRAANDGEVAGVVDTALASARERYDLMMRATTEGNGELCGLLMTEHPDIYDGAGDASDTDDDAGPAEPDDEPADDPAAWDPAGLVTVKTVYPEDSPYHGMPGLEGPPSSWLATVQQDLASMGINPVAAVTSVRLWRPRAPATHYEVGAVIDGVYTKIHVTGAGYGLIYNARSPSAADPAVGQFTDYQTAGVTASDLYGTFLQMASERMYDVETYDCQDFAGDLCSRLSGQWVDA